jgi:GT2 family glycosyltransferase
MSSDLPEIAVGLLSFNRAEEVLRTLRLFMLSDYPAEKLHLVVVDNASVDGTGERVLEEFGDRVEVVRLEENIGAIARNVTILGRTEKYIFQFDEDTAPADPDTLRRAVAWMESHPAFGALCFRSLNIHSARSDWGPLEKFASRRLPDGAYEGMFMIGNGMCFRREAVQRSMGYDPRIFWGAEELHFCLELLYHDIAIAYHPDLVIVHRQPPRAMPRAQVVEMEVRNNVRAYMTFMPLVLGAMMSALHCLRRLGQAALHRNRDHADATVRGARRAWREMPEVMATRRPIPMGRFARHNRWIFLTFIGLPGSPVHAGDAERVARTNAALAGFARAQAASTT